MAVFETRAAMADEAAGLLVAGGALGCAVRGMPRHIRDSRGDVSLEAYFPRDARPELAAIRSAMRSAGMLSHNDRKSHPRSVVDPGWAVTWKRRFEPTRIGARFLIVPPWKRASEPNRVTIVIRPGQGFGTGHHPTTAGAMRSIDQVGRTRSAKRVLDVGTGSGILAIASALLGAKSVTALDIDPAAIENARGNASLNRVADRIRFSNIPPKSLRAKFDLVIANILSSALIELAPALKRRLDDDGTLILGGILRREADLVASHYRDLRHIGTRIDRGWATMVFGR